MKKGISRRIIKYTVFLVMVVLTILLSIDNVNAGIYADEHNLNGATVGWFAPYGVIVFLILATLTFIYGLYLFLTHGKK